MYRVFHRTWWRRNPKWPGGREPGAGRQYTIRRNVPTEAEAQQLCREWNANHDPGPLSDKAEYDEQ